MLVQTELHKECLTVSISDVTLNLHTADQFKRQLLLGIQKEPGFRDIAILMENVQLLDSTGLGALLFALRQAHLKQGKCYLVKPAPKVVKLLKIAKLDSEFSLTDSLEEISSYKE